MLLPTWRKAAWPALAVALAALGVALMRLPYGIMFADEGFYLATADGVQMGAVPFRDDLSQAATPFFLVLTPILRLLPEGGTLLHVRLVGLALRAVCCGVLLLSLRRWLSPLSLAAAFAVALLANFTFLLIPSYNSLPSDLGYVAVACWIYAAERRDAPRAWCFGLLAGLLFGLGALCYLPRVAFVAVPLGAALWTRARPQADGAGLRRSSLACALGILAAFGCALLGLAASGLSTDFARGIAWFLSLRPFGLSFAQRLYGLLAGDLPRAFASALVQAAFWTAALALCARATQRGRRAWLWWLGFLLVAAGYALLLVRLYDAAQDRWHWAYYRIYPGLCWLPLLAYPWLRSDLRAEPGLTRAAGLLFVTGLTQQLLVAATSTQGTAAGVSGLAASLALLLLLAAAFARRHSITPAAARHATGVASLGLGLALAATAATRHFYADQNPFRGPQATFVDGRLAGLRSHPRYVKGWSAVVRYLAPRLVPGESLLAYDNAPLLYYATRTRPALGATYVSRALYTPAQLRALLTAMLAAKREPRYAVRLREGTEDESVWYSTSPEEDPLNAYVLEHFELEARLPLFDVFRRR
jgi:hypothetical protein